MTFEEAKKEIDRCMKQSHYEMLTNNADVGIERAYKRALEILEAVGPGESVFMDSVMTLNELAKELRKFFFFKYLTIHRVDIYLWRDRPLFVEKYHAWSDAQDIATINATDLNYSLDLSEYRDADGIIDYSKCIVEVE